MGCAVSVVHDQARTFGRRREVAHDVRFLDAGGSYGQLDVVGCLLEHRSAGQGDADRRIDFVRHAGHQAAQRGQPFGLQQRFLRLPQVLQRTLRFASGPAGRVLGLPNPDNGALEPALDLIETADHVPQFIVPVFGQFLDIIGAAGGQVEQPIAQALERVEHHAQRERQRQHQEDVEDQYFDEFADQFGPERRIGLGPVERDDHLANRDGHDRRAGRCRILVHQHRVDAVADRIGHGASVEQGAGWGAHLAGEQTDGAVVDADRAQFGRQHFGLDDTIDLGLVQVPQRRRQADLQPGDDALAQAHGAVLELLAQRILGIRARNGQHHRDDQHE